MLKLGDPICDIALRRSRRRESPAARLAAMDERRRAWRSIAEAFTDLDLDRSSGRASALRLIDEQNSLLVVVSPVCTMFSTLQNLTKHDGKWKERKHYDGKEGSPAEDEEWDGAE